MTSVTIFGAGTMGGAIAKIATDAGADVQTIGRQPTEVITGDIVVLAVPYVAVDSILANYAPQLDGHIVVDISNPVDLATLRSVVPPGTSAAEVIATRLPGSKVLKAFNTTLAGTLTSGKVGDLKTTVMVAGDDRAAKRTLMALIEAGGLGAVDAGPLSRARELEGMGTLQLTLAVAEQISWNRGFALVP